MVKENWETIKCIAEGGDIWHPTASLPLKSFRDLYLRTYSALPTNTQFTERGVKESGYVSLGRRGETNRSVMAISRGKLIPDALKRGREDILSTGPSTDQKEKQLQGKKRTKVLMQELIQQHAQIKNLGLKRKQEGVDFTAAQKTMKQSLTLTNNQWKKKRIGRKVDQIKQKAYNTPAPNIYERRTGQTLTPLMSGKIQYHKMKKEHNMVQVRNELAARNISFDTSTSWTAMLKLLKQHEKDNKYFRPRTSYDSFKWNSNHFEE